MKTLSMLFLLALSSSAFANDPFDPGYFKGSYQVDLSRSDSGCPFHAGQDVTVDGDSKGLTLKSADNEDVFGGINQPEYVYDGESNFVHDHETASTDYSNHIISSHYSMAELPFALFSVSHTLQKNSDGSLSDKQSMIGFEPDKDYDTFNCTLMLK